MTRSMSSLPNSDDDQNDPTVWECIGQRLTPKGVEFRHLFLTRSVQDHLRTQFGQVWLHNYKLSAELDVREWEAFRA